MVLTLGMDSAVLWQQMLRHERLAATERGAVVIVPVGSVEQRGPHLPLDVDISVPYYLAIRAAVACSDLPVLVAPLVTFGLAHYKMGNRGRLASAWRHSWRSSVMWHEASGRMDSVASSSSTAMAAIFT